MENWKKFLSESKKEKMSPDEALEKEGGAIGMKMLSDLTGMSEKELEDLISTRDDLEIHKDGDIIDTSGLSEEVELETEDSLHEKKKKKKKKKKKAKRDACYHKVKSRYDVWPSAYASGALVKCRKVGAKNWGNKSKKTNEEANNANKRGNPLSTATAKKIAERCQKGYKTHPTRKTKKMYGKTYRNCVKANEDVSIDEKRKGGKKDGKGAKSKGYSLRDWFKGGGWVQTGGKHDGKPCAKQPGQKTKPYCRDPDDRAKLSKKEKDKRAKKKRKEDPNPDRKGKAKNVTQGKKK